MTPRSEPLLWLQLIGLGVLPLEALLLLLLLAGSDPGSLPALERLLCWALGALAPGLLLWRQPADVWSLLLLQTPLRGRRQLQQRLSRLQEGLPLQLGLAAGVLLALPLLWWIDDHAALAGSWAPLAATPRLGILLLASLLLAVMLWQWQQLLQAVWLLSRTPQQLAAVTPMGQQELELRRLCLGLPLLLPPALAEAEPSAAAATKPEPSAVAAVTTDGLSGSVDEQQAGEQNDGPELDQQVS